MKPQLTQIWYKDQKTMEHIITAEYNDCMITQCPSPIGALISTHQKQPRNLVKEAWEVNEDSY